MKNIPWEKDLNQEFRISVKGKSRKERSAGVHAAVKASGEKFGDPVVCASMSSVTHEAFDEELKGCPFEWTYDCFLQIDEGVPTDEIVFTPV
jgi:hypothetical protein